MKTPTPNPAAQALGRLAAGHAKTMTDAAKAQRKAAGIASGKVRSEAAKARLSNARAREHAANVARDARKVLPLG